MLVLALSPFLNRQFEYRGYQYIACNFICRTRVKSCSAYCSQVKNYVFHSFIQSFSHSMTLQSFVWPWPLFQFPNNFHTVGRTPWTSDQPVARPLPTHRTTQTENKLTHATMP
jgi:hypothetical protein